jgi:U4/U6 small nuclear ribonucleoprotein PRP3
MLVCPSAFSLVVVEGVPKALKRYHKLMLRRINWAEAPAAAADGAGEDEEEEGGAADKQANSCHLVWEVRVGGCCTPGRMLDLAVCQIY